MLSPHCTDVIPPLYWRYPPTVLNTLHSTDVIPCMYWCYPPMYWIPSTVLKLSPHCTDVIPHCTEQPPQYWRYPPRYWSYPPACTAVIPPRCWRYPFTVLNTLHSTDVRPPWCWCCSPHCTEPPLRYWSCPPTVLKLSPHCTEQPPRCWSFPLTVLKLSPHGTDVIPPMYWAASNVLNNLHSTGPTLCGVRLSREWVSGSRVVHDCLTEDWEKPSKGGDYLFLPRVSHNRARLKIDDKRMKI